MGLFNSGKNEKVEKVSKYERHYNVPQNSSRRRSSKHRSHQGETNVRAMSQPPLMRIGAGNGGQGGFYQPAAAVFSPPVISSGGVGVGMGPTVMPPVRYPIPQFDLSKYTSANAFQGNPFVGGQIGAMNLAPFWNNGLGLVNNRSAFQQPLTDYQQTAWPGISQSNYGFMPQMQF
jgi:hypothetical protein